MAQRRKRTGFQWIFRVLSDPTRLRLLHLANGRELCVCYLTEVLRLSQPKISRHLAYLRRFRLVTARRQGKWMHYRLILPRHAAAAGILKNTLELIRTHPQMQYDLAHLDRASCSPDKYNVPRGAPTPKVLTKTAAMLRFLSPNKHTRRS